MEMVEVVEEKSVVEYIKNPKKNLNGCMIGIKVDDEYFIGFSKCSPLDKFNKKIAYEIAYGRAKMFTGSRNLSDCMPSSYRKKFIEFNDRCRRYFKDANPNYSIVKFLSTITKK